MRLPQVLLVPDYPGLAAPGDRAFTGRTMDDFCADAAPGERMNTVISDTGGSIRPEQRNSSGVVS